LIGSKQYVYYPPQEVISVQNRMSIVGLTCKNIRGVGG